MDTRGIIESPTLTAEQALAMKEKWERHAMSAAEWRRLIGFTPDDEPPAYRIVEYPSKGTTSVIVTTPELHAPVADGGHDPHCVSYLPTVERCTCRGWVDGWDETE